MVVIITTDKEESTLQPPIRALFSIPLAALTRRIFLPKQEAVVRQAHHERKIPQTFRCTPKALPG
jgi:hypothetical protein